MVENKVNRSVKISNDTLKLIRNSVIPDYISHHPDLEGFHISMEHIINKMALFWLESK